MKNLLLSISLIVSLSCSISIGQNNSGTRPSRTSDWCKTDEHFQKYLDQNNHRAEYAAWKKAALIRYVEKYLGPQSDKSLQAIRTVPIIVHVLFNPNDTINEPFVPDSLIYEMIDIMNQDYTHTNPDVSATRAIFQNLTGDAQINFCLALRDPNGNPTTGIHRVDVTATTYDPDGNDEMKSTAAGGTDSWDPAQYLNIWICDITDGAGSGTAGYATMHGSAGMPNSDGLVLDSDIGIGDYSGQDNRTASHEIGHYLGLEHTWGLAQSCTNDDGFGDTPNTSSDNMSVTCGFLPEPNTCDAGAPGDTVDQYENFMSYATCQNMFSKMQVAYMNSVLDNERASLLTSIACQPPISADFKGVPLVINVGDFVTFTDLTTDGTPISWAWTFPGGYVQTTSSLENPVIQYGFTPGFYDVTLTATDTLGSSTETKTAYIEVIEPTSLVARFSSDYTVINAGSVVNYYDESYYGIPTSWSWSFIGSDSLTSTLKNPMNIRYNTPGVYQVSLTVSDGMYTDAFTVLEYITVLPMDSIVGKFVANQTVIYEGDSINFQDLSTNQPTFWNWSFPGGTPTSSTQQHPSEIAYTTAGVYDVTLMVKDTIQGNIYKGDTLTKYGYIIVLPDSARAPVAFFESTQTLLIPDENTTFIDQSANYPTSWTWVFEGGIPSGAIGQFPPMVSYSDTGYFDVTLVVSNALGSDTLIKYDYIHVIPINVIVDTPAVAFTAGGRLIYASESVNFFDLSANYPTSWTWTFEKENNTFITSYDQNPFQIVYNVPGLYYVTLKACNLYGCETLKKEEYIVVSDTSWADPKGYCDTLQNFTIADLPLTYRDISGDGTSYLPGHNTENMKGYAEKYSSWTLNQLHAAILPVKITQPGTSASYIRFKIWIGTDRPDSVIYSQKVYLNTLYPNTDCFIEFDSIVSLEGPFFMGFDHLDYNSVPRDYFVVAMATPRGPTGVNSMYVLKGLDWYTPEEYATQFNEPDFNIRSSLAIRPIGCLVGIEEFENPAEDILVFPVPSMDIVNINLGDHHISSFNCRVFDISGRQLQIPVSEISNNHYQLSFASQSQGIYFVSVKVNDAVVTKRVSIIR